MNSGKEESGSAKYAADAMTRTRESLNCRARVSCTRSALMNGSREALTSTVPSACIKSWGGSEGILTICRCVKVKNRGETNNISKSEICSHDIISLQDYSQMI
jgi:hypothetical protein